MLRKFESSVFGIFSLGLFKTRFYNLVILSFSYLDRPESSSGLLDDLGPTYHRVSHERLEGLSEGKG
jgi:hypothetical protein